MNRRAELVSRVRGRQRKKLLVTAARQDWSLQVQFNAGKLAHRPRPLPTVRAVILPKEAATTERLLMGEA